MTDLRSSERHRLRKLNRAQLSQYQLCRLNELLSTVLLSNRFYSEQLRNVALPLDTLEILSEFPFTRKCDLVGDNDSQFALNRTYPSDHYVRFHRTSGTSGNPLGVCDTSLDWQWWIETWQFVLDAAEVTSHDIALLAFSFGPFIGFWSANDALAYRGTMVIPTGGMSTIARLRTLTHLGTTVLCCTPSYALHMAEVAVAENLDVAGSSVRVIILAGEPGGSIPSTRKRIQQRWGARVIDHAGASEVGPWGYGNVSGHGLHVIESEFLVEFLCPDSDLPSSDGEDAELVLTTLGRSGAPVIRYRTGDLVRPIHDHSNPDQFVYLEGGVLGRVDDMVVIRGVNVYPTAVEEVVRRFPEVSEYRAIVSRDGDLDALTIEVEAPEDTTKRLASELHLQLGVRVTVLAVEAACLPRFELKSQRFLDQR